MARRELVICAATVEAIAPLAVVRWEAGERTVEIVPPADDSHCPLDCERVCADCEG